jgi:hypothetical protein
MLVYQRVTEGKCSDSEMKNGNEWDLIGLLW